MAVTPYGPLSANPPRAQLGESIRALTQTLRMPDLASVRHQLRGLLDPLRAAFAEHRAATEGSDGIYAEVVCDAPRLANTVDGLVAEHAALDSAMAALARRADEVSADAESLRRHAYEVLDDLSRHRQHDADLVYEAYATDIGGE